MSVAFESDATVSDTAEFQVKLSERDSSGFSLELVDAPMF